MRLLWALVLVGISCNPSGKQPPPAPIRPPSETRGAPAVVIDRFSDRAGKLLVRSANPRLPGPGQPFTLDSGFVTQGLGPDGATVRYYHFDVQPAEAAIVYRVVKPGTRDVVANSLDIIDVIPGDPGYSDFWRYAFVEMPAGATAQITSRATLEHAGWPIVLDDVAHNCPVVPRGTEAKEGIGGPPTVRERWYRGQRAVCLDFGGEPLLLDDGKVPTSPIHVAFVKNPGTPGGGPASGFLRESANPVRTHNVVGSIPGDTDYSPLWAVQIYDNSAFDRVRDAATAELAPLLVKDAALVNCPIVFVGSL